MTFVPEMAILALHRIRTAALKRNMWVSEGSERELKIKPVRDNHEQILRPEPLPHLLCPALEKDIGQKADPLIVRD